MAPDRSAEGSAAHGLVAVERVAAAATDLVSIVENLQPLIAPRRAEERSATKSMSATGARPHGLGKDTGGSMWTHQCGDGDQGHGDSSSVLTRKRQCRLRHIPSSGYAQRGSTPTPRLGQGFPASWGLKTSGAHEQQERR